MTQYNGEIIDVHTHIFNLNYLPVRGVLQSYGAPTPIAYLVAIILKQFTNNPRTFRGYKGIIDEDAFNFTQELLETNEDLIIEHLAKNVSQDVYYNENFQNYLQEAIEQGLIESDVEVESFMLTNKGLTTLEIDTKIYNMMKKILGLLKGIFNYIKWFFFMMRSEEKIYNLLVRSYGNEVNHFVFHMMDTRYFFNGKPRLSINKQIKKMKHYIDQSNGKLIGFVPFNPKRSATSGMKIISNALNNGFTGVKFYPPLGYRASRNDEIIPNIPNVKNGNIIESKINNFFNFCVESDNDVPVFTHCTPTGFQAKPKLKSGKNAHPMFWKSLLDKPKFHNLRLCLGHAGGEEGWAASSDEKFENSYAYLVYTLCITYPNVYCEVGFLAHIRNSSEKQNFVKRLQELISKNEGEYDFGKKIMYGSDWHILFNDGLELNYHKKFMEIFDNNILRDYQEDFFSLNARNYLKLNTVIV